MTISRVLRCRAVLVLIAAFLPSAFASATSVLGEHVFLWMPWNQPIDRNNGNAPPSNFSFCFDGVYRMDCTSTINIRYYAPGQYSVTWDLFYFGAANDTGIAAAYGSNKYCGLSFGGTGGAYTTPANIRCFNANGTAAHTKFLFRKADALSAGGYTSGPAGWGLVGAQGGLTQNFNPSVEVWQTPPYDVAVKPSTGRYFVLFKGQQADRGTAHVVAANPIKNRCVIANWFGDFDLLLGELVDVMCFAPNGVLQDTAFHVLFEDNKANRLGRAHPLAYGYNEYAGATIVLPASRAFSDRNGDVMIHPVFDERGRVPGARDVVLAGYAGRANKSHFLVTAVDDKANYCVIQQWGAVGNDLAMRVHCFDRFGSLSDTRFTFAFYGAIP